MEPKCREDEDDVGYKMSRLKLAEKPGRIKSLEAKALPPKDDESRVAEAKLDLEVEREWKELQSDTSGGRIEVSSNPRARKICKGLTINYMNMRCADTGKLMWQSKEWRDDVFTVEQEAHIPSSILKCSAVSREVNFSSTEEITQFRLEQRVFFQGSCIEEWLFTFGFVIPGSTNSWQQTIESAGPDNMLDPEVMSGKLTIETGFYDGQMPIAKTVYRIFYV
ncbi:hypothetical protein Poli38472_003356 [Pythium oligandrum]|uniref:GMP phosphodiesterase delta subunit domain-containing protein n=1 Tax=Pythium oligandrum TaxID=41045 RepID=A0A8K1C6Q4_PYTOL|nr:hypothetical protein Poli38472_003356 [Pythium oligandrum]|eukprot:TMW57431.1 hypothetical protein Poli38472_003356 [Pythium oligandrum]